MKKFVFGLFCGVLMSTASAASASETVKTFLTQATLVFHVNGKVAHTDAGEVDLLTYEDRLYVPLRYFSEQMGATVDYLPQEARRMDAPRVVMTYEDQNNLTLTEASESLRIGHVDVDFGQLERLNPPTVTGIVAVDKPIPEGKEAVIEIQDPEGNAIAQSEYMIPGGRPEYADPRGIPLHAFKVGEVRPFKVKFPYVPEITDYRVAVKLVDATSWRFKQESGYAQEDYPFDVSLGTKHDLSEPVQKGSAIPIRLFLTNTSDHALKIIRAPFEIELPGDQNIVLDALTDTVIPGNHGAFTVSFEWKADVDPGFYRIRLKEPFEFQYEEEGTVKNYYSNGDMWTAFPITVE